MRNLSSPLETCPASCCGWATTTLITRAAGFHARPVRDVFVLYLSLVFRISNGAPHEFLTGSSPANPKFPDITVRLRTATILFFLLFAFSAQAGLDVVINEIAWMGTENSYNDEWLELYNNTDSSINLEGWILKAVDGTPEINLAGIISGKGFYLLERTDDTTLPEIMMDQKYVGALGNEGEALELYDNLGNLVDSIRCSSGWFAGDNSTKQTMERKNPLLVSNFDNWTTSQNPGGTPKAKNSLTPGTAQEEPEPESRPQPAQSVEEPQPEPGSEVLPELKEPQPELLPPAGALPKVSGSEPINYPSGIIINEVLPSPIGPDTEEEWVEIFNQNEKEVNLSLWQIVDTAGVTNTYTFPGGTKIGPKGFLVLFRPATKITLNNDSDGISLIQPDGKTIDSVNYEKATRGQSYNRTEAGWAWSTTLTPGSANIIPTPITETKKTETPEEEVKEPAPKKGAEEPLVKKELAALGEQISETSNTLFIFLIALSIATFSGATVLILKKKLRSFALSKKLE